MEKPLTSRPFWEKFLLDYVHQPKEQDKLLKEVMDQYNISLKEFSEQSDIPEGTLYKISSSKFFDIRVSTLNKLINTLKRFETKTLEFPAIGVITARHALQEIESVISIDEGAFSVAEYPAATIEEEIIQGISAQNDGCIAIICGPIAANTLSRVVRIPVIGLQFNREQLNKALKEAVKKVKS
ncbi:MAG: transcriptional regulator [Candidatus Heimdallarchaeota archaeon]|nr:transcriptional regulator [Candidatus Heimdallarchaeota archaeon]